MCCEALIFKIIQKQAFIVRLGVHDVHVGNYGTEPFRSRAN